MQVRLEIQTGPRAGETIAVQDGETVTVGRTANSSFALPEDTFLSRVHFAVECDGSAGQLTDRQSANGTALNGSRVTRRVTLHEGDVIDAGQTKFLVRIAGDAAPVAASGQSIRERPAQLPLARVEGPEFVTAPNTVSIGSWFFGFIPDRWQVVEGFGLRRHERNSFPSEAMVSESTLAQGESFGQYVESQLDLVRLLLSQPQIRPVEPPAIRGAEEDRAFVVRYKRDDGRRFLQRQVYVRREQIAGALAFTTLESEAPAIQPFLDQILRGLAFGKTGD